MRKISYGCAMSLDGFIAGPGGEADWIVMDPDIDFQAAADRFDTYLMGRRTFEATGGRDGSSRGMRTFVFSRTLRQSDYRNITIVGEDWRESCGRFAGRLARTSGSSVAVTCSAAWRRKASSTRWRWR